MSLLGRCPWCWSLAVTSVASGPEGFGSVLTGPAVPSLPLTFWINEEKQVFHQKQPNTEPVEKLLTRKLTGDSLQEASHRQDHKQELEIESERKTCFPKRRGMLPPYGMEVWEGKDSGKAHISKSILAEDESDVPICGNSAIWIQQVGEKTYKCPECGKLQPEFIPEPAREDPPGREILQLLPMWKEFHPQFEPDHQWIHSGEKPYQCSEHEETFSQRSNVIRHQRTHTGERHNLCNKCGKSFSQLASHYPPAKPQG